MHDYLQSVSLTVKDYKSNLPVAILCGGKGTRLREETEFRPKPMIAIGNRPIIWHIMKTYAHYGLTDFMLCLGYKGEMIRDYFFSYDWNQSDVLLELGNKKVTKLDSGHEEEDWRIWLIDTGQETMTGGRLKRLTPYIDQSGSEIFLATYGDGVCDVNIADLLDFHYCHGKLATMTAVRPSSRFGELIIEGNLVTQFQEKPQTAEGWINGGYFVLNRKVLDLIEGDATTFEAQPLRTLAALGELAVYKHEGFWQCMDTYREMEMLNHLYDTGQARWKIW
ncbi:MAG: glucose-1-phosphate cytidylyltransferase [Microcystis sp. M54BS1]|uniref:glucose-1-phosphate cytidylyltransferase n=1 Tax=unclassified Microcystis TaxID=2643300 RepID=UPI0018818146|nr:MULTISPECIES: glucose-1-phosphate cytidylyltransferase [unclassified Microcystis]MCA2539159.1 glucose-1-phosphate cytidylyltransferase [Microcystis sp. M54BS1]MCA2595650.1 glucose-1-phosphate cytidylyltransferase [Microcystis sp. M38BS1]MCA2610649.1 glucose-1-phosphate cytidylyltransferase [Microcystis sp. M27BS1]MBE9074925.1 glucose-1-phosphate cytidylyltransferase [Microcystis sp. LEGE 08355]MCA2504171.1 glucose-1-phosphate cytidylyltransferase [Microcystis sp. M62BS1]